MMGLKTEIFNRKERLNINKINFNPSYYFPATSDTNRTFKIN